MKTENLKVAIFPIGSSMKFRSDVIKRSDGTSEYYKLVYGLLRNESVSEVWILQRSDWKKLSSEEKIAIDPRGILRDIYSEFSVTVSPGRRPDENGVVSQHSEADRTKYVNLWESVKHLEQPDFGLGFATQGLTMVNIPGIIPSIKEPHRMTGALDMTCIYSAPIIHYLNMSNLPWFMISTDPRYVKLNQKWRDMVNPPVENIAQYNTVINVTHFDTYPEPSKGKEIVTPLKLTYSGIERLNMIGEEIYRPDTERDIKFSIVAMQSAWGANPKDYRLDELKKWIFTQPGGDDCHVYGKWDERFTEGYPQFQGFKTSDEIDEIFKRTRTTFVIPIRPDWVTSKYIEMLRVGVLPFFHPDYDTQFNIVPKDHYIRVYSPKELSTKIAEMEESPEKRIRLVKELQLKFLAGVRKGLFLADTINPFLERAELPIRLGKEYNDTVLREPDPIVNVTTKAEKVNSKSLF